MLSGHTIQKKKIFIEKNMDTDNKKETMKVGRLDKTNQTL
jgi:hypothetical protein